MTVSLLPNHISRWWRCERWEESETEPKKYNRAKLGDTDTQKNTDGTNKMSTESIMVGGVPQKMSFFQMVRKSFLSDQTYST